jgi:hypothetical protein
MQDQSALTILKRAGRVLIVVGALDIGLMIYCIVHGIPYSSSFNIFAVIAGIFLLRGSYRAASYVRRLAIFMLSFELSGIVFVLPILFSLSLAIAEVRFNSGFVVRTIISVGADTLLLSWIIFELGHETVLNRIALTKGRKLSTPFLASSGIALGIVLAFFLGFLFNGSDAKQAKEVAFSQLGASYQYQIRSLNISTNGSQSSVSGVVIAWNSKEIREVPVHWQTN